MKRTRSLVAYVVVLLVANGRQVSGRELSLDEAVKIAKRRRSEVAQADLDLQRASIALLNARLERVHFTVQASVSEQLQNQTIGIPQQLLGSEPATLCGTSDICNYEAHPFVASATLTVPLWSGFTVEADIARAHALEEAAQARKRATVNRLGVEVARAYWAVRRGELQLELADRGIARQDRFEQLTKKRVDAGIAPPVDLSRAHIQSVRQRIARTSLAEQVQTARAELASVLQLDDEDDLQLTEDPQKHAPLLPPLGATEHTARAARPEIQLATAELEAQSQTVRSLKGGYWPQVGLFGSAVAANQSFYVTPPSREEDMTVSLVVGAKLQWIIFDTLSTFNAVRDAGYVRQRLDQDRIRLRYTVTAEVREAHSHLAHSMERQPLVDDAVATARESLDTMRKRYEVGNALLIELLGAESDLLALEAAQIDNRIAVAKNDAELQGALGKL